MSVDLEIARQFAEDIRRSELPRIRRRVTTILDAYGSLRLTDNMRNRIATSFDKAGIVSEPSMLTADRSTSLRISLAEVADERRRESGPMVGMPKGVQIWERRGARWLPTTSSTSGSGVLLVDVNLSLVDKSEALVKPLLLLLEGLDEETLQDLLDRDDHAEFKDVAESAATRASLFVVVPDVGTTETPDDSIFTSLGVIEFAAGAKWVLIVRHLLQSYADGVPALVNQPVPSATQYVASLDDYGLGRASTSKAVALSVINQAVDSFGRTRDDLASYIESWRNAFYDGSREDRLLRAVQATLPLLLDALVPFKHPSVKNWVENDLKGLNVDNLSERILRNVDALRSLSRTTSTAIGEAYQARSEQIQLNLAEAARQQQLRNEQYQANLATLAAVLLAPGLVASIFGANTVLSDSPVKLLWLILAMLIAGIATRFLIRRRLQPESRRHLGTQKSHPSDVGVTAPQRVVATAPSPGAAKSSATRVMNGGDAKTPRG